MKPKWIAFLLLVFTAGMLALGQSNAAPSAISMVGTVGNVTFGVPPETLVNAPNGHISFQKTEAGYRVWVPGRLPITPTPTATPTSTASPSFHEEGGFLVDVTNWPSPAPSLEFPTLPTFVLGHVVDDNHPNCGAYIFDRNYKALNAVVPGPNPNILWGFYDAEYHVACSSEPLLSSIGMATSNDGGITWNDEGQVIQGLDEATFGAADSDDPDYDGDSVIDKQWALAKPSPIGSPVTKDSGASGPSAVIPGDGYIYVYYADRTPFTGGPDSIYVARAQVSASPAWQKWNGGTQNGGWSNDPKSATPIVAPSASANIALQPHVSWNTSLNEWLMVFKTANDFEVATSVDGLHWHPPVSLLTFDPNDKDTGFPTLISTDEGETSQQYTGKNVWLYYSSLPSPPPSPTPSVTPSGIPIDFHHYHGHFVQFTINDLTPPVTAATVTGPLLNGWYTGPTTVSFTATDDLSGVASTQYSLDSGETWSSGSSVLLTTSGTHNILYRSIDVDGNVEVPNSISVTLDVTPPDITASPNHPIILNNVPLATVTISGTVTDSLSGVDRTSGKFVVHDEYGKVHLSGPVTIASDGSYSFTISLRTFARANDTDGRLYTIWVSAADSVGNSRTTETFVTAKRFKAPPPPCKPHCV